VWHRNEQQTRAGAGQAGRNVIRQRPGDVVALAALGRHKHKTLVRGAVDAVCSPGDDAGYLQPFDTKVSSGLNSAAVR
jgi:hypothetical protein